MHDVLAHLVVLAGITPFRFSTRFAVVGFSSARPIRDYIARRTTEGKTPRVIKDCLRRDVTRHLHRQLQDKPATA